jgi:hypothetical protein
VGDSSATLSHQIGLVSDQIQIALVYVLGERKVKTGVVLKNVEDLSCFQMRQGGIENRAISDG